MEQICQPTKEQVREWLKERLATREPPPEIKQIQRGVGWVGRSETRQMTAANDGHRFAAPIPLRDE
jgi:hypothetical protein